MSGSLDLCRALRPSDINDFIESAPEHLAPLLILPFMRASDTALRLIVTDRPDLDNFRLADDALGMWKVMRFYVQRDYSVRMGTGKGHALPGYFVDAVREGASR